MARFAVLGGNQEGGSRHLILPEEVAKRGQIEEVRSAVRGMMKTSGYHCFGHAEDVFAAAGRHAYFEGISAEDWHVLGTAALLHDVIQETFATDNEERSVEFARKLLPKLGYADHQVEIVGELIMVTKLPTRPVTLLQRMICDADVDNLGREDFFVKTDLFRIEMGVKDPIEWMKSTLAFMQVHTYYTRSAVGMRAYGKERNMQMLRDLIDQNTPYKEALRRN